MKYTPMKTQCDLTESTFNYAMQTMYVPIYLHVHPSRIERAKEILAKRDMTPSRFIEGEPKLVIAVADESITNVEEWYLVTAIGSNPP